MIPVRAAACCLDGRNDTGRQGTRLKKPLPLPYGLKIDPRQRRMKEIGKKVGKMHNCVSAVIRRFLSIRHPPSYSLSLSPPILRKYIFHHFVGRIKKKRGGKSPARRIPSSSLDGPNGRKQEIGIFEARKRPERTGESIG